APREPGVVGEITRVAVERVEREPPRGAQLVQPGFDPLLERPEGGGDHASPPAREGGSPSSAPRPRCADTRLASASGMRARRAISSGLADDKAVTEPNALSSWARRAGPTPGTWSRSLRVRARVRSLRWYWRPKRCASSRS